MECPQKITERVIKTVKSSFLLYAWEPGGLGQEWEGDFSMILLNTVTMAMCQLFKIINVIK